MVRVALLNLLGSLFLASCAQPARELPPDISYLAPSERLLPGDLERYEYKLSCVELNNLLIETRTEISNVEMQLDKIKNKNQSIGVASVLLFYPAIALMDNAEDVKHRHLELEEKKEILLRIAQARKCSM